MQQRASSASRWFKQYRVCRRPALRLFCFPYAGGGAAVFDGWQFAMPEGVDVFAVQAPGRADRFTEAPIADLTRKVALLRDAIAAYLDVPYLFVGHSNGALTAFELARSLEAAGSANLRHLVISAKRAPHLPGRTILHRLSDDDLLAELRSFSATPPAVLGNRELMHLVMPMLRADFALAERAQVGRHPRLRAACTLFLGRSDLEVDREDLLAWRDYIAGPVELKEFDGDHFFIDKSRTAVLDAVREIVGRELTM